MAHRPWNGVTIVRYFSNIVKLDNMKLGFNFYERSYSVCNRAECDSCGKYDSLRELWRHVSALLLLLLTLGVQGVWGQTGKWSDYQDAKGYGGGNGSKESPYLISTAEQLALLASRVSAGTNYAGKYFMLTADIDLGEHWWQPIGALANNTKSKLFQGTFDGQLHTISNMKIDWTSGTPNTDEKWGLFSTLYQATVSNIVFENAQITAQKDYQFTTHKNLGILAGELNENVTVSQIIIRNSEINDGGHWTHPDGSYILGAFVSERNESLRAGGLTGYVASGVSPVVTNIVSDVDIDFSKSQASSMGIWSTSNGRNFLGGVFGYVDMTSVKGFSNLSVLGSIKKGSKGNWESANAYYGATSNRNTNVGDDWFAGTAQQLADKFYVFRPMEEVHESTHLLPIHTLTTEAINSNGEIVPDGHYYWTLDGEEIVGETGKSVTLRTSVKSRQIAVCVRRDVNSFYADDEWDGKSNKDFVYSKTIGATGAKEGDVIRVYFETEPNTWYWHIQIQGGHYKGDLAIEGLKNTGGWTQLIFSNAGKTYGNAEKDDFKNMSFTEAEKTAFRNHYIDIELTHDRFDKLVTYDGTWQDRETSVVFTIQREGGCSVSSIELIRTEQGSASTPIQEIMYDYTYNYTMAPESWKRDAKHLYASWYAGGSGTAAKPYLIENGAQLALLSYHISSTSSTTYAPRYYMLTNDIDLDGAIWCPIGEVGYHSPAEKCFSGTFDGDGYIISNMYYDWTQDAPTENDIVTEYGAGLFTKLRGSDTQRCAVKNLIFENASLTFEGSGPSKALTEDVGIVAGTVFQNCDIENIIIRNSCAISNPYAFTEYISLNAGSVAGLVNSKSVNLRNITSGASLAIKNTSAEEVYVGGIFGQGKADTKSESELRDLYYWGSLEGTQNALAGSIYGKTVEPNFVLQNTDNAMKWFVAGTVVGDYQWAEELTKNEDNCNEICTIWNKYEADSLRSDLYGFFYSDSKFSFLSIKQTHEETHLINQHVITYNLKNDAAAGSYIYKWYLGDDELSGFSGNTATYTTAAVAQDAHIVVYDGSEKVGQTAFTIEPEYWYRHIYSDEFDASSGSGDTPDDPIIISNGAQLAKLTKDVAAGTYYSGKYFAINNDIELGEAIWIPIGNASGSRCFRGNLDGRGYEIRQMKSYWSDAASGRFGLFAKIVGTSTAWVGIKNLVIDQAELIHRSPVTQTDTYNVGILAGEAGDYSSVRNIIVRDSKITNEGIGFSQADKEFNVGGVIGKAAGSASHYKLGFLFADVDFTLTNNTDFMASSLAGVIGKTTVAKAQNLYAKSDFYLSSTELKPYPVAGVAATSYNEWYYDCAATADVPMNVIPQGIANPYVDQKCKDFRDLTNQTLMSDGTNELLNWAYLEGTTPTSRDGKYYFYPFSAACSETHTADYEHTITLNIKDRSGVEIDYDNYDFKWSITGNELEGWDAPIEEVGTYKKAFAAYQLAQNVSVSLHSKADPDKVLWQNAIIVSRERFAEGHIIDTKYANSGSANAGSAENPYQIATAAQLSLLSKEAAEGLTSGKYYIVTDDISLANAEWLPIGGTTGKFEGSFDGNARVISDMWTEWNGAASEKKALNSGLFGRVEGTETTTASVKNVIVEGATLAATKAVSMSERNVGVVIGQVRAYTNISNIIVRSSSVTDNGLVAEEMSGKGFRVGGAIGSIICSSGKADIFNIATNVTFNLSNVKVNDYVDVEFGSTANGPCVGGIVGWNYIKKLTGYTYPSYLYSSCDFQNMPKDGSNSPINLQVGSIYGLASSSAKKASNLVGWYYTKFIDANKNPKSFQGKAENNYLVNVPARHNQAILSIYGFGAQNPGLYSWATEGQNLTLRADAEIEEIDADDEKCLFTVQVTPCFIPKNVKYSYYVDDVLVKDKSTDNTLKISYMLTGRKVYAKVYENDNLFAITNSIELTANKKTTTIFFSSTGNLEGDFGETDPSIYDCKWYEKDDEDADENTTCKGYKECANKSDADFLEVFFKGDKVDPATDVPTGESVNDLVLSTLAFQRYVLKDGTIFRNNMPFYARQFKYIRSFYNGEWQPLVLPVGFRQEELQGRFDVTRLFDVCIELDKNEEYIRYTKMLMIRVQEGSVLEPNVPYMIRAHENGENQVVLDLEDCVIETSTPLHQMCSSVRADFTFISTYEGMGTSTDANGTPYNNPWTGMDNYVMSGGVWRHINSRASLNPQRFYLRITEDRYDTPYYTDPNNTPEIRMVILGEEDDVEDGIETGIAQLENASEGTVRLKSSEIGLKPGKYLISGKNVTVE